MIRKGEPGPRRTGVIPPAADADPVMVSLWEHVQLRPERYEDLARRCGMDVSAFSRTLTGRVIPRLTTLRRLVDGLDLDLQVVRRETDEHPDRHPLASGHPGACPESHGGDDGPTAGAPQR